MKQFRWSEDKNKLLKKERNVSFEDIIKAFDEGNIIDNISNPNQKKFPDQKFFVALVNKYTYVVPYVETETEIFLKTIYPSRKYRKKYEK